MFSHPSGIDAVLRTAQGSRRLALPLFVIQWTVAAALWSEIDRSVLIWWVAGAAVNAVRMFVVNHLTIRRIEQGRPDPRSAQRVAVHGVTGALVWGVLPVLADRYGSESATFLAYVFVLGALCGAILGTALWRH